MFWGCYSSLNILSWNFAFWVLFDFMLVTSPLLREGPTQPRLFFKFTSGTSSEKLCSGLCPDRFEMSLSSSSFFFLILTSKESSEDYLTPNPRILKINENTSNKNMLKKKRRIQSHCYIWGESTLGAEPQSWSAAALICQKCPILRHSVWPRQHFTTFKGKHNGR